MKNYLNFSARELTCKCGRCDVDDSDMDSDFMDTLSKIRRVPGVGAMIVSSAFRCPKHNTSVSVTGLLGPHTTGKAIDIACRSARRRSLIISTALGLGITRIGVGKSFIHLDVLTEEDGFDENVIWTY